MRTAQEYQNQIKVLSEAIGIKERTLLIAQMSEYPDFPRIKAIRWSISNLEQKMKYLSGQHRKAERIEARESESVSKS
jgi:hypothetical protein